MEIEAIWGIVWCLAAGVISTVVWVCKKRKENMVENKENKLSLILNLSELTIKLEEHKEVDLIRFYVRNETNDGGQDIKEFGMGLSLKQYPMKELTVVIDEIKEYENKKFDVDRVGDVVVDAIEKEIGKKRLKPNRGKYTILSIEHDTSKSVEDMLKKSIGTKLSKRGIKAQVEDRYDRLMRQIDEGGMFG